MRWPHSRQRIGSRGFISFSLWHSKSKWNIFVKFDIINGFTLFTWADVDHRCFCGSSRIFAAAGRWFRHDYPSLDPSKWFVISEIALTLVPKYLQMNVTHGSLKGTKLRFLFTSETNEKFKQFKEFNSAGMAQGKNKIKTKLPDNVKTKSNKTNKKNSAFHARKSMKNKFHCKTCWTDTITYLFYFRSSGAEENGRKIEDPSSDYEVSEHEKWRRDAFASNLHGSNI